MTNSITNENVKLLKVVIPRKQIFKHKKKNYGKDVIDLGGCYQLRPLRGHESINQHLQFFSFVKSTTEDVLTLVHQQNQRSDRMGNARAAS